MSIEESAKILAALEICTNNIRDCAECPAYDPDAGNTTQMRKCRELLSDENIQMAIEIARG